MTLVGPFGTTLISGKLDIAQKKKHDRLTKDIHFRFQIKHQLLENIYKNPDKRQQQSWMKSGIETPMKFSSNEKEI